ncbi:type III pantothenate kinase [Rhodocytophaga aerolata]|uniref:Type III pantothenate kinase n=1 Tax=Rhodocytophaga aerolata TaxID=455078 RepID=A0ABT8RC54_9BACT|nr:type III pantothenate kinase [Rhodocytophaga aerolata]MDO1448285.1 type III pantothenate kinase [Rhodocytophaga aerolata]
MNIAIDIGNTSLKAGLFEKSALKEVYRGLSINTLPEFVQKLGVANCIISSVSQDAQPLYQQLQPYTQKVLILDHQLPLPLINEYETPQTLGKDRLAAVAGATAVHPNTDCLVIDMGTCITYDIIKADGHYLGGSISPGLRMRFKALHTFTARLPLIEPVQEAGLTGKNTYDAILSGVIYGMTAEIEGIISKYQTIFPKLDVIFCGGDANFFESKIKQRIFVIPELVLIGLNRILEHNVSYS